MTCRPLSIAVLALFFASSVFCADKPKAKEPETIQELQTEIEKVLKDTHTPGVGLAIVSAEKVEWIAGLGLADVAANKPATPKTLFRIGSISKSFAALTTLKLQEQGKLKLSDTLRQWVPEVAFENRWEDTDPIRLVHLMEHTSGLPDMQLPEYANNDPKPVALSDAIKVYPQYRVTRWRPGTRMAYSNTGPALLALVIEKATDRRFEDIVKAEIFEPLGMKGADYLLTPEVEKNRTLCYEPDGKTVLPYWHIFYRPAGSINASAEDMARVLRFYLQRGSLDGTKLLEASDIDRMERPMTLPMSRQGIRIGYGLYNYATFEGGIEFHGHSGGMPGALAEMMYSTQLNRGYVVMINTSNGGALWRISHLVRRYLVRGQKEPEAPRVATLSPDFQTAYSGTYMSVSPRTSGANGWIERFVGVRRVKAGADKLALYPMLSTKPEKWLPVTSTCFRRDNQPVPSLVFYQDREGRVTMQSAAGTAQKISTVGYWSVLSGFVISLVLVISSLGFAPVWGLRKLLGKLGNPGPLSVRVLPFVGSLMVLALFICSLILTATSDLRLLGTPNARTISLFVITLLVPLFALLSAVAVRRHRHAEMNRVAYWHSAAVTFALLFLSGFGAFIGLIGWRLWA